MKCALKHKWNQKNYRQGLQRIIGGALLLILICSGLGSARLNAAEQLIFLKTGERLRGEVLDDSTPTRLFVRSNILGVINVPRDAVEKIETISASESAVAMQAAVKPKADQSEAQGEKLAVAKATAEELIENLENLETTQEEKTADKPEPKDDAQAVAESTVESEESEAAAEASDETKALATALVTAEKLLETVQGLEAPKSWKGSLRFGINLYEGDTQEWTESYFRGKLEVKPEKSPSFYRFEGSYTYRETAPEGQDPYKSTDKYDATFTYRRSFAEDWFFQNTLGWRVDQIKGIDSEVQELLGIGYQYKWRDKLELIIGAGGGIEDYDTNFEDTREGKNSVVNVFQELSWKLMDRTELTQQFNYYSDPEDSESYNYVFKAGLRFRFSDLLGLEFSYNKEFESDLGNGASRRDTQLRNSLIVFF